MYRLQADKTRFFRLHPGSLKIDCPGLSRKTGDKTKSDKKENT